MNWFIGTTKAIEEWIIPGEWVIWIQWGEDIYTWICDWNRVSTVSCMQHPRVSFVIQWTQNKCNALSQDWKCSLSFKDENTPLNDCPIINILESFSWKKEVA